MKLRHAILFAIFVCGINIMIFMPKQANAMQVLNKAISTADVQLDEGEDLGILYPDGVKEEFQNVMKEMDSELLKTMQSSYVTYNEAVEEIGFDYLGGAYYDEEGKLHILVKEYAILQKGNNSVPLLRTLIEKNNVEGNTFVEYSKYSYNELMNYKSIINTYFGQYGIIAAGIDDKMNKVIIYVSNIDELPFLDKEVPYDAIMIEVGSIEMEDLSYTAYCGAGLYNTTRNSAASLACGVVWDRSTSPRYGFLTAGHFAQTDDQIDLFDNASGEYVTLGTVVKSKNSGSMDAGLIESSNPDVIQTSATIDGSYYSFCGGVPAQNQPITAYGYRSGIATGVVISTSFDIGDFTDMVSTSAVVVNGDSGGAVIAPITTPELSITGIIKGKIQILSRSGMIYTKFNNIMDEWDLNGLK